MVFYDLSTYSVYLFLIFTTQMINVENTSDDVSIIDNIKQKREELLKEQVFNFVARTVFLYDNTFNQAKKLDKLQQPFIKPFPCNITGYRSSIRPSSVHKLRPGDIDVIGSIGDSLTVSNGAAAGNLLQLVIENRGLSWTIGGQGDWSMYLTLPNIIKVFNPNLIGYSLGDSMSHHIQSQFNVGEPGAMSKDIPYMARLLVKRIMNDRRVNFKEDWKLITSMIGGNDFCSDICYLKDPYMALVRYKEDLIKMVTYLKNNLPRTLLQIVIFPNFEYFVKNNFPTICDIAHKLECSCLFGLTHKQKRRKLFEIILEWQKIEMEVALNPNFTSDDFTVVYQPFLKDFKVLTKLENGSETFDLSYFTVDCLHLSQKGCSKAANSLWNNLLEPVHNKSTDWEKEYTKFLCPTKEHPFFFTNINSKIIN